jgi:hypothetical protein
VRNDADELTIFLKREDTKKANKMKTRNPTKHGLYADLELVLNVRSSHQLQIKMEGKLCSHKFKIIATLKCCEEQ